MLCRSCFIVAVLTVIAGLGSSFRPLFPTALKLRNLKKYPSTYSNPSFVQVPYERLSTDNLRLQAISTVGSVPLTFSPKSKNIAVNFALALLGYLVGNYFLRSRRPVETAIHPLVSQSPISIFINGKSGGKEGRKVVDHLLQFIPKEKVCDLGTEKPAAKLLTSLTLENSTTLSTAKQSNETNQSRLAICCGGDGTMKWVMEEAKHLNISQKMQFGLIPMGTGNDLFNHIVSSYLAPEEGKTVRSILNPSGMLSLTSTVLEMFSMSTKKCKFDRWQINIVKPMKRMDGYFDNEVEGVELLAQADSTASGVGKRRKVKKLLKQLKANLLSNFIILPLKTKQKKIQFNNYFGIGIDGEITSAYDSLRKLRPYLFFHRLVNKFWYILVWIYKFLRFRYQSLSDTLEIYCDGQLIDIKQQEFRGIILANINSYAGGCKLWEGEEPWKPLSSEDGMIEVSNLKQHIRYPPLRLIFKLFLFFTRLLAFLI